MSQSEGFLAAGLATEIAAIREQYAPWFAAATAFNTLGMQVLPSLKVSTTDNQQLIAAALYGRALASYQSALLLAQRGLLADARTVIRAATETVIVLIAVIKDAAVCDQLVDRHFWHHLKLRNAWLNDPQALAQMKPEEIDAVKATIAAAEADHPKTKTIKSDPVTIATLAASAGATALYNAVYRSTSGDAAHTSLDVLNRHIRADAEGNIQGLKFGPDVSDLPHTLSDAMSVLGHALDAVLQLFPSPAFVDELARCTAAWKALGIPKDYRPPEGQP